MRPLVALVAMALVASTSPGALAASVDGLPAEASEACNLFDALCIVDCMVWVVIAILNGNDPGPCI